jgi:hypothetical protein
MIPSSGRSIGFIAAELLEHDQLVKTEFVRLDQTCDPEIQAASKFAINNLRASKQEIAGTLRSRK